METDFNEIDEGTDYVGYQEAFNLVGSNIPLVGVEEIPVDLCAGRVVAEDLVALVSNPSSDVSLKDGFAVKSEDVADASMKRQVCLISPHVRFVIMIIGLAAMRTGRYWLIIL